MSTRYLARFSDPEGKRYGLPTYQWESAPIGLLTRRQLRARGLCPGGQDPVAQIMWRRKRQTTVAYLYDLSLARKKRIPTPAVLDSIAEALRARRTCPSCGHEQSYYIPRSLGECLDCADGAPAPEVAV